MDYNNFKMHGIPAYRVLEDDKIFGYILDGEFAYVHDEEVKIITMPTVVNYDGFVLLSNT